MFAHWLQRQWFRRRQSVVLMPFLPLCVLFRMLVAIRRRVIRSTTLPVPVVVVGNITVGGAGKTPLTLWLTRQLIERGWHPAIVSRGYGGKNESPRHVMPYSSAEEVGDEPLLMARRCTCPVWIGQDRVAAAEALLDKHPEVDIILCDDGLQHLRLGRDMELAVFDGRGAGNGCLLPCGPLREPMGRLRTVDAVIWNGVRDERVELVAPQLPAFDMRLKSDRFYRLDDELQTCTPADLKGRRLYALAGIGDPGRFFKTLRKLGLQVKGQPFPDHHTYTREDLAFAADGVLLMTEKDAVKCAGLVTGESWVLPIEADLSPALTDYILERLHGRKIA